MTQVLGPIAIIALVAYYLAKITDIWLSKKEKRRIIDKIEDAWIKFDDANFIVVVQAPLKLLAYMYDTFLGTAIISGQVVLKMSLLSIGVLVMSMAMQIVTNQHPFDMWNAPFLHYDEQFKSLQTYIIDNKQEIISKAPDTPQQRDVNNKLFAYCDNVMTYNTITLKVIYTISYTLIYIVLLGLLNTVTISLTRLLLKEVLIATRILVMVSILTFDLFLVLLISSFVMSFMTLLAFPVSIPLLFNIVPHVVDYPTLFSGIYLVISLILFKYGSGLIKIIVAITIMPSILLYLSICLSLITFPIREGVYKFINRFLLQGIEYEKGFVIFLSVFFGVIAGMVTLISKYLI